MKQIKIKVLILVLGFVVLLGVVYVVVVVDSEMIYDKEKFGLVGQYVDDVMIMV